MAQNSLPGYILKDISLNLDGNMRIGQTSELTIFVLERTMEDFRNAGMIKPRRVSMGYEATNASFKETSFDPEAMKMMAVGRGKNHQVIGYGYLESENGEEHEARVEMTCEFVKMDPGAWATATKAENDYEITVHSGKLFVDNDEVYSFDDFEISIGGQVQNPGRRSALRMA